MATGNMIFLVTLKAELSRRFYHAFVKTAQMFDKEPLFENEIALRAPRRKYQLISRRKKKQKQVSSDFSETT